ncbi:MAG: DNA methyltransferase [Candidatus Poribacteria bacterium]|nr:DNA methyltransferase [Candidatus Poribacteria bacterium]
MIQDIANTLYEMDNLEVLRGINSNSIDLIATDPPFNTQRNRSSSAGFYVDKWKYGDTGKLPDQWKWNEVHPKWLETIQDGHPALYQVVESTKMVQGEDTAAFLCFLSVRLLEMHRILKDNGAIYLHCDHTANAYIRMAMDAIFGKKNLRNEIVWCYTGPGSPKMRQFNRKHDTIFWYSKGKQWTFNKDQIRLPYAESTILRGKYDSNSPTTGSGFRDTERGKVPEDWWNGFPSGGQMSRQERTGSPDQKPLKLYERIIEASSNEGDIVLDPFCGCATTIIAAHNLKRRWIGIDRRKDARYHIITRLMGISPKERKRLEKHATDREWLDRQMQRYEIHYRTEPPTRTDNQETAAAELPSVFPMTEEFQMTRQEIHQVLIEEFGPYCWGCNFKAPDPRYLELDHINPKDGKDDYGQHHINNRALLCKPCNSEKGNRMTLPQLRRINKQKGYMKEGTLIDLSKASEWTWRYLVKRIQEAPHEYNSEGM